jgi:hypothetical protein
MRSIPQKVASSEAARHVGAVLWLTIPALPFGGQRRLRHLCNITNHPDREKEITLFVAEGVAFPETK